MVNIKQMVWEPMKYLIFDLRHMSKVAAHFQRKTYIHMIVVHIFMQASKQRNWKNIKKTKLQSRI